MEESEKIKTSVQKITLLMLAVVLMLSVFAFIAVGLQQNNVALAADEEVAAESEDSLAIATEKTKQVKGWAAAIVIASVAIAGAISMGLAIIKAIDGIARQPEAEGKIRTTMMLGLVFVETAIIYALIVAILVIFVL